MESQEETFKRAAIAIPDGESDRFKELATDIVRENLSVAVADEHVLADPPSRREEYEGLSDDAAVLRVGGSNHLAHLKDSIAETKKRLGPEYTRSEAKRQNHGQFLERDRERRLNAPLIVSGLLKGISLGLLASVAVVSEAFMLHNQVREWLSSDEAEQPQEIGHFLVAFMIVSGLAIVTHAALDEKRPKPVRVGAGGVVALFSIALGLLRSYSTAASDQFLVLLIGGFVWIAVSLFAPIVAAYCIQSAAPSLKSFIDSIELGWRWRRNGRDLQSETLGAEGAVSILKDKLAALLDEFPGSRRKLIAEDQGHIEMARAARRLIPASVARAYISWQFFKRKKASPDWALKDLLFAGAAIVTGAFLLMGCSPAHPEKTAKPANWVVVCDRSSSSSENPACSNDRLKTACAQWAKRALPAGGRIELLLMGKGISDTKSVLLAERPRKFAPPAKRSRTEWVRAVEESCGKMELPDLGAASGVAEGLYAGVSRLRGLSGESSILLLSDMRAVSPGAFNFEVATPSYADFSRWLDSQGPLDVGNISIAVCGANLGTRSSPVSMSEHNKLRELWERVFREKWRFANLPTLSEECLFDFL